MKKSFFEKKILPGYLCRYDLQNGVETFFLNKWVSRYLSFGGFKVLKSSSSQKSNNKTINKTRSTKNPENSTQRFIGNYLTNHHAKFLKDRFNSEELEPVVGALRICTGYQFI